MRSNRLALAILLLALPFTAQAQESVSRVKPGRPETAPVFTKRSVTESAVTDLCTQSDGRECVILNRTDQDLCLKAPAADETCGSTTITCTSDTDLIIVLAGESWFHVLESGGTLCGKMAAAPTGDCATPASTACVYSVEAL